MTATPDPDQDPAAVDPATGRIAPAVLDALGDQLDQRRAQRQAEGEHAKATAHTCSRCGAGESWLAPGKGGWHHDAMGAICARCDAERRDFGRPEDADRHRRPHAGAILPDAEHRAKVIARLLGPERAREQWPPLLVERARELLPWFCEVPGAEPGRGVEGFAYVDLAALVGKLHAPLPPPAKRYSRGRRVRCAGCGCRGACWWAEQVAVSAAVTSTGELSSVRGAHFRLTWTCASCRHQDVELLAAQLPDVPVARVATG